MKNQLLILALLTLLTVLPAFAQDYTPRYEEFVLANGLNVVLHRDTTQPIISVNMTYRAGSSLDPEEQTGLANLAAEALLVGTKNVPREELLRLRHDENVSISAQTNVDWISIASVFPMTRLEAAVMIEADRMETAVEYFTERHLDAMIRNLNASHARREREPLGTFTQQVYEELYAPGHPYRHIIVGRPEHVKNITIEAVRHFSRQYHVPSNAYLTIGGNFDPEMAKAYLDKYFRNISPGQSVGWANIPDDFTPIGQGISLREDRVRYQQLHLVFPTARSGHPDEAALLLLSKILIGSEHSLLYSNLVKTNAMIHSVEASQTSSELAGTFWITVTTKIDTRLSSIYQQVHRILQSIAEKGVTQDELTAARNQAAMHLYESIETLHGFGGRCDVLNLGNLYGDSPDHKFSLLKDQQSVNSTAIRRVTTQYLSDNNQVVFSIVPIGKSDFAFTE
ncbi:MAG: insulinase family protein [Bacteroidetes bacterium]|nr:insulinase family protein [Bacteroidota bacterium]